MKYYSLSGHSQKVSFEKAVVEGIAPDRGLYFPESLQPLPASFFEQIDSMSNLEIAQKAISQFIGDEIQESALQSILEKVLDFDFPVVPITDNIATLELFHGPTMAFKDVGARFMAQCLGYFNQNKSQNVTVLVATSGDTGGAVANGFLGVEGVDVVILYPKGRVSEIQERQLTTLGQNITALEVEGTFDDCQEMVKTAFLDTDITDKRQLTSANSINVARWLPQLFYFLFAYQQLTSEGKEKEIVFSVPSGNFGNICAGIVAHKLGMPISKFIASVNTNDTVVRYLASGNYDPKPSVATISNAMDVSNPSNFIRIEKLFSNDLAHLKEKFTSYSYDDTATRQAMLELQDKGYIADPHGAVGYLGLKEFGLSENQQGVFLETAHPIKFLDTVKETLNIDLDLPKQIQAVMGKDMVKTPIQNYKQFKAYLIK